MDREISEFHTRFRPFVGRIYRGALIFTGNPTTAKGLQVEIYLKAYLEYVQSGPIVNFKNWLTEIVDACLRDHRSRRANPLINKDRTLEQVIQSIAADCEGHFDVD